MPVEPGHRVVHRLVGLPRATTTDRVAADRRIAGVQLSRGNDHRGDSGAGHAPGPFAKIRFVSPRAVDILAVLPMFQRQPPDFVVDWHSGPLGLVQAQQGELRIGIVADVRGTRLGIGPHSRPRPLFDLLLLEPPGIATDQMKIFLGLGGAKHHRLQRVGVRRAGMKEAQVDQGLANRLVVRPAATIQQGQRAQRGQTAPIIGLLGPGPLVGVLQFLQILHAPLDQFADFLRTDRRFLGSAGQPHRRRNRHDRNQQRRNPQCTAHRPLPPLAPVRDRPLPARGVETRQRRWGGLAGKKRRRATRHAPQVALTILAAGRLGGQRRRLAHCPTAPSRGKMAIEHAARPAKGLLRLSSKAKSSPTRRGSVRQALGSWPGGGCS